MLMVRIILWKYSRMSKVSYTTLQETNDKLVELKNLLQSEIAENSLHEVNRITGAAVKEASCKMRPGKMDVSTSCTSDALLNAPDIFFYMLSQLGLYE